MKNTQRSSSLCLWFSQFVQEVFSELVLSLFQVGLGHANVSLNRDVQTVFIAAQVVNIHEIDNAGGVVPSPSSQQTWSINSTGTHVVVKQWVEVLETQTTHGPPKSSHFQFSLVVHVSDQLLTILELAIEIGKFSPVQVWTLLKNSLLSIFGLLTNLKALDLISRSMLAGMFLVLTNLFLRSS